MSSLLCQSPVAIKESGHFCPEVLPLRLSPSYSDPDGGATCVRLKAGTAFWDGVDATGSTCSQQAILSRHSRARKHTAGPDRIVCPEHVERVRATMRDHRQLRNPELTFEAIGSSLPFLTHEHQ
jgi:hypothetical protein